MADNSTTDSAEHVAYKLLSVIASNESKSFGGMSPATADRKWLLDTYAECIDAVKGTRSYTSK